LFEAVGDVDVAANGTWVPCSKSFNFELYGGS
jgi:hypothetical protein